MYDYKSVLPSRYFGDAAITTQRNRVKTYGSNVYLKDKQEFEIELFNPTNSTKLAKISINGKLISQSGLVLKPGQRVYLERFIDTAKKFLFETYEIDGSAEAQAAIVKNGDVEISFYDEYVEPVRNYLSNNSWTYSVGNYSGTTSSYSGGMKINSLSSQPKQMFKSATSGASGQSVERSSSETGRVEKGSHSSQEFTQYQGKFNAWTTNIVSIKILPFSQKPQEVQDLAEYCTSCGTKNRKNNYKFCPKCGTKYE